MCVRILQFQLKGKGVIDDLTYRRLRTIDGVIPRTYGVTKQNTQTKLSIENYCLIGK